MRADIARLAHPALAGAAKRKKKKAAAKTSRWSEYEQLAIARAVAEGKRVHHVVVQVDPQCGMPIAGRQMIQLALAGLGEVLAIYPVDGSLEPMNRVEAALASEKPVEQIRAKCNIPTIALNVRVTPLRPQTPSHPLAPARLPALNSPILNARIRNSTIRSRRWRLPRSLPASLRKTRRRQGKPRLHPPRRAGPTTCCAWMRKKLTAYSILWVN